MISLDLLNIIMFDLIQLKFVNLPDPGEKKKANKTDCTHDNENDHNQAECTMTFQWIVLLILQKVVIQYELTGEALICGEGGGGSCHICNIMQLRLIIVISKKIMYRQMTFFLYLVAL